MSSHTDSTSKPIPKIKAWEDLSFIELLQLRKMTQDAGFEEDKQYLTDLTEYINQMAKYEQNKRSQTI